MRAAGFLLACLPGGSSQDDVGTADCFFYGINLISFISFSAIVQAATI